MRPNNSTLEELQLTKQLTKESMFAYRVLQQAAGKAGKYPTTQDGSDGNIIIAGGAIRDLYFDRESRDVDIYYNSSVIAPADFATAFKNVNAKKLAAEFGFDSVEIIRLSDNTKMGTGGENDGEDWGDVDDRTKIELTNFVDWIIHFKSVGDSFSVAILRAHQQMPMIQSKLKNQGAEYHFVQKLLRQANIGANVKTRSGNNSGVGSKMGRAHPLKSVEEFQFIFNGNRWDALHVELMAVERSPIEYVREHFAVKLSRAYFDGHGIHFTPDFMQDARGKTITVACPVEHARFERLFSYYLPKMQSYFPDFDIRVDLKAMNGSGW